MLRLSCYLLVICILMGASVSCRKKSNISYSTYNSDTITHFDLKEEVVYTDYYLEDILDSIRLVPLETTSESFVANVYKTILTGDRIIIRDDYQQCGVIIFDINGKFVKRLVRGNGPGEITRVNSIGYNNHTNEIVLLDGPFIQIFDTNGNHLLTQELYFPCDNIIACLPEGYIFSKVYGHISSSLPESEGYSLIVTDKELNVKQLLLPYSPSSKIVTSPNMSFSYDDKVYITVPFSDSIYYYHNDSVYLSRTFDISNKKIDVSKIKSMEEHIEQVYINKSVSGFEFQGGYLETHTHNAFTFMENTHPSTYYMNKKTGKVYGGRYCLWDNSKALPVTTNPIGVYQNWFVNLMAPDSEDRNKITSYRYISQEDVAKLNNMTDDSNPFIVFYKLKDF